MFKILFVDDQESSVMDAKNLLETDGGHECYICGFSKAEIFINRIAPHVIILDLLEGQSISESKQSGRETLDFIWNIRFCPIIFYTAVPEYLEDDCRVCNHPFVKKVKKGNRSQYEIKNAIDSLIGHINAIKKAENGLYQIFCMAIRDLAENTFRDFQDDQIRDEILVRCGRRRIGASIDNSLFGDKTMSWEQYIYPPISIDPKLGDIIQETNGKSDNPDSFRIILTPSCDLSSSNRRHPIENVLVAKCFTVAELKSGTPLYKIKEQEEFKKSLISNALSQGYYQKMLIIPKLPSKFPDMIANLKKLELIPFSEISNNDTTKFTRITSVDSPFRELVSWAYMQIGCRPGLPERDFERWAEDIMPQLWKTK